MGCITCRDSDSISTFLNLMHNVIVSFFLWRSIGMYGMAYTYYLQSRVAVASQLGTTDEHGRADARRCRCLGVQSMGSRRDGLIQETARCKTESCMSSISTHRRSMEH